MIFKTVLAATAATLVAAIPASASDAKLYPYRGKANYCPSGLQPVVMGGVISCGIPNQPVTYAQMKAHPAAHSRASSRKDRRLVCPAGEKGCFYE